MNTAVTLTAEEFKVLHNSLCDLDRFGQFKEIADIVERIRQVALKSAYEQDSTAFDRKHDYYGRFREANGLTTIWSVYELQEHGFLQDHPWQGAKSLCYHDRHTAPIQGPTWGDLYRAADEVIRRSGDSHHIFIEGFYHSVKGDNTVLELTTGS